MVSTSIIGDTETFLKNHEQKELVHILTCGSVDDGKSTLIGRLLLDAGLLAEDTLKALEEDSKIYGTVDGAIDPALLMDGLQAEREQGITIDVAHRYFFTEKRVFILADVPGHAQYTRNMATAASTSEMAVVLIDATKGVTEQTYRHTAIISLCGIRHVLVAINKMDSVDYDEAVFDRIREKFTECCTRLEFTDLHFIPVSALCGDNVVNPSKYMPWYQGGTLLHLLETVHIASDRNLIDFRFPVQYVLRPDSTYRGYAGTVASGVIRSGDEIVALPSGLKSTIRSIDTFDGTLTEAFAGQSVTLTLTDEIDLSRGDVLSHSQNVPDLTDQLEVMMVWMNEEPLTEGEEYIVRLGRAETRATITTLRYELDVETHRRKDASELSMNAIGRVALHIHQPFPCDAYKRNRVMGSLVLIDRVSNATVGAGMIVDRKGGKLQDACVVKTPDRASLRTTNLIKESGSITPEQRQNSWKQKPATLLFTGLSGSGKSTIAHALERRLFEHGHVAVVLDGENVRLGLNRDLGFSTEERFENVRRVMEMAKLLNDAGVIVLCALVSPTEEIRNNARAVIGEENFLLIHCDVPLDVCRERHPKKLYQKAETEDVPGVSSAYEVPKDADLILDTRKEEIDKFVREIIDLMQKNGYLL